MIAPKLMFCKDPNKYLPKLQTVVISMKTGYYFRPNIIFLRTHIF